MRSLTGLALVLSLVAALGAASPANAVVRIAFGTSWDGPGNSLQAIVDALYGAGKIDVTTDYLGAKPEDPDPWFWLDDGFSSLLVNEVAGNANFNRVGWYQEAGGPPLIQMDGIHDDLVFEGLAGSGASVLVYLPQPMTRFGFYLNPNGDGDAVNAPEPELFYTNRTLNDAGPDGGTVLHQPYGGDVQALVFDVSAWTQPNTWLVCWEDLDSGAMPGPQGLAETDNDFNDLIFEVTAIGATPVEHLTLGALKAKYAR